MSWFRRFYTLLIRLYPRRFRETFAEEMIAVFQMALSEAAAQGWGSVAIVFMRELLDLPASIIREHLHERRLSIQEEAPMDNRIAFYRFCMIASLASIVIYVLLVVAPFFIYGIHQQPHNQIIGGRFDPKGYWLFDYQTTIGSFLNILAVSVMVTSPIWSVGFGLIFGIGFVRLWGWQFATQHRLITLCLLLNIGVLWFTFTPLGRLILAWHMD